ncbi:hypothetical protein HID58_087931 [Brassica napus]|uniref:Uncharacterized protein n=1 Tax=Brassica napus TaxID=3708 RepID=A0ABQ7XUN0_BRANA|nr:hypothetical protein HID58_087931 [Brassica napus]
MQEVHKEDHLEGKTQLLCHRRCVVKLFQVAWKGKPGRRRYGRRIQEETREEGELQDVEEVALAPVSKEFQEALADTQAAVSEVISNQEDEDEGLQRIQSLVVSDRASERKEEDVMDMDEIQAALLEHGLDEQAIDALPAVSGGGDSRINDGGL